MLVLFNTGYRIGYIGNVFRTLFLPEGADNEYRYGIGETAQVTKDEIATIRAQIGENALICFGDRYASVDGIPQYIFYPMRRGEVVAAEESGGRLFVKVRLAQFVNVGEPEEFTRDLYRCATRDGFALLRYTQHAENEQDGRYVYSVPDESALLDRLPKGDGSWLLTVKQLADLTTFKDKLDGRESIFSRVTVQSRRQPVVYSTIKKAQMADLEKDDDLRFVLHYYFPSQDVSKAARALLKITSPNGAQILAPAVHELGMKESRIELPIAFEPGSDKKFFSFDFAFEAISGGAPVVGAAESVVIRAKDTYWRQLVMWIAIVAYMVSVALAKDHPLGGALGQGVSLIFMLTFVGKKVV